MPSAQKDQASTTGFMKQWGELTPNYPPTPPPAPAGLLKMRYLTRLLLFLGLLASSAYSDDIRDKISAGNQESGPGIIIPGDSIFGFKIGSKEEELFQKLGKPKGYVRLDAENTAAIYDNDKGFIFTNGVLSGIRIGRSLFDFRLMKEFGERTMFYGSEWRLNNGIVDRMPLEEVKKIVGNKLKQAGEIPSEYHQVYEEGTSTIHLFFSSSTPANGDGKRSFLISGILMTTKAGEDAARRP